MTYPPIWQNWWQRMFAEMIAQSSTVTSPANFVELPMMIPDPMTQSCAICTDSISRLLLPTFVVPFEAVPLEMVTFSRIELLSPTSQSVSSPLNFKSCGLVEILAPGNISLLLPIRAPKCMVTLFWNTLLSPITVFPVKCNRTDQWCCYHPVLPLDEQRLMAYLIHDNIIL